MNEVAEEEIDPITQANNLFTHPNKLDPKELADDGTTPAENHRDKGG